MSLINHYKNMFKPVNFRGTYFEKMNTTNKFHVDVELTCVLFLVTAFQSCHRRLYAQSAADITIPDMPSTDFKPNPYSVNC